MAHNSVDLIEEDAADLQFPKDPGGNPFDTQDVNSCQKQFCDITSKLSNYPYRLYNERNFDLKCDCCDIDLIEPFIACAECSGLYECLLCFASGREFKNHKNDHSYIVLHDNLNLFSEQWTALEEKQLLDLILRLGYGNWDDISKSMITKTADECRNHYNKYYIDRLGSKSLPKFLEKNVCLPPTPYLFNLDNVEDPPRFMPTSSHFNLYAGYRAARSDFDSPYDANAEKILNCINVLDGLESEENYELFRELHWAIARVYNHRISERWRRYKIMRTHGLISPRKTAGWLSILDQVVDSNAGSCLSKLMQLCDAENFTLLIEGLLMEAEMKRYLFSLYNLRENGIKSLAGGELYNTLKEAREKRLRECSRPEDDPYSVYSLSRNPAIHGLTESDATIMFAKERALPNPRRKSVPLNILGMPGYDRLTSMERELCSLIRLIPDMFLTYRDQLISEYNTNGCLRLGDARKLIKIDVNKTRQIYDHLIKEGYIKKPFD